MPHRADAASRLRSALVAPLCFGVLLAVEAHAASLLLPLAADSPRPVMEYGVVRYEGGVPGANRVVHVTAASGFADVETGVENLNPVADVMAMQFSYPAASFDGTAQTASGPIHLSITIDATTERIENLSPPAPLASFGLGLPGEQLSYIDPAQHLRRMSFGFTLQTADTSFHLDSADCESSESVCIHPLSAFTGTVDGFALTRLEFLGSTPFINDESFVSIPLGTDALGFSWQLWLTTYYGLFAPRGDPPPIVFTPEPSTGLLFGAGLVALAAGRRS